MSDFRRRAARALLCAVVAASAPCPALAEKFIGDLTVPKVAGAPAIDGTLGDPLWKSATKVTLGYDLRTHSPADQQTTWYLMTDGAFLYVAVDVSQREPVRATQRTNGVGLDTDDEVQIDLWPNGSKGFRYKFTSTPIGTHYQYSTENSDFEPTWWSAGTIVPRGYVVTMKIPMDVMHGASTGSWRVQLLRYVQTTDTIFEWSYGSAQGDFNDVVYSGALSGLPRLAALRERPRVGIYGLAALGSQAAGGSTSRAGADISLPIVSGTALVATIHPDYSDVALDQQTIAPTAFARFFEDVRPFFTQGANFESYPDGICVNCPGGELYTPGIPTPRDGIAIEGERGLFNYAAFHAVGFSRTDTAEAINYVAPDLKDSLDFQSTQSEQPGLHDAAAGFHLLHDNLTDFKEFVRYANNAGTDVVDPGRAQRYEAGFVAYSPYSSLQFAARKFGASFLPVDGFLPQPDIAGYAVDFERQIKSAATARINEVDVSAILDRYHDHVAGLDRADQSLQVSAHTPALFDVRASTGSQAVAYVPGTLTWVNQNGVAIDYDRFGAAPSTIGYQRGRFGPGELGAWTRSATLKTGSRGLLTLEADDTRQAADSGQGYTQWLERASLAYEARADESLAVGVRRIIGCAPLVVTTACLPPPQCAVVPGAECSVSAWNVSAAYRRKFQNGELYLVYGDAALLSTSPQFIVKFVHYFGADKGT